MQVRAHDAVAVLRAGIDQEEFALLQPPVALPRHPIVHDGGVLPRTRRTAVDALGTVEGEAVVARLEQHALDLVEGVHSVYGRRVDTGELVHRLVDQVLGAATARPEALRLLDRGFFRIGSEDYAVENETYGLATMRKEHVRFTNGSLVFDSSLFRTGGRYSNPSPIDRAASS